MSIILDRNEVESNRDLYIEPSAVSLGRYTAGSTWEHLSPAAIAALKIRIVDSIGCAGGSFDAPPVRAVRQYIDEAGGNPVATFIGGGRGTPEQAAFYNGALVRYLDFNDAYASQRGGGGHPSDNLSAVMAVAEFAGASGKDLLVGLAVAYHVQTTLAEAASNTRQRYDHTTVGAYSSAAGAARALGLNAEQAANAIGIAGASQNALYVTRTGGISNWKGLAFPFTGSNTVRIALLARLGVTGPLKVIEGTDGLIETFTTPFYIDWDQENREGVTKTVLKRYNAQIHSQAPLEGVIELVKEYDVAPGTVERIDVSIFQNAYDSVGGGRSGPKTDVRSKEAADHSLPYMLAAAALDREMMPRQYEDERILRQDVQTLLRKVTIRPDDALTARFPREHACHIEITLTDGTKIAKDKVDYEGFETRPMSWDQTCEKARELWRGTGDPGVLEEAFEAVDGLEEMDARQLTDVLGRLNA
jgi:2-methylcitrate dehydratase